MRRLSRHVQLLVSAGLLALATSSPAQTPVSTGRVVELSERQGSMTLRTDQGYILHYTGLVPGQIRFSNGRLATFRDIQINQPATVTYVVDGNEWFVGKVLVDPTPSPSPRFPLP